MNNTNNYLAEQMQKLEQLKMQMQGQQGQGLIPNQNIQTPQRALEIQQEQLYQRFMSEPVGIQSAQEANRHMQSKFEAWCAQIGVGQQSPTTDLSKQVQEMQGQIQALMDQNKQLADQNKNMTDLFKTRVQQ